MSFRWVSLGDVVGRVLIGARLPRLGNCADGDLGIIVGIDCDPGLQSRMLPPELGSLSIPCLLTLCLAKSFHIPSKNWLTSFSAESSVLRAFW